MGTERLWSLQKCPRETRKNGLETEECKRVKS